MPEHPSHPVTVAPGSRLAGVLGERAVVNSYHHQAVDRLPPPRPPGPRGGGAGAAGAWADDGIVEAIELPAQSFAVGVQWELQESWHDGAAGFGVFAAFVAACRGRSARRRPAAAA